ncbi:MAG: endonuclease/exonuclease/phosphatase family protein, partial [bacterium]
MTKSKSLLLLCLLGVSSALVIACHPATNYLDPEGPKFSGNFAPGNAVFSDTVKIVTFNIEFAQKIDQAILELSTTEELKNADIILLQEMDEQGSERIAQALKYNFVYYPAIRYTRENRNFGNAILTRWPIGYTKKILLPFEAPGNNTRRIAVAAAIGVGQLEVLAYSVHTATIVQRESKRLAQVDSLARSIPPDIKFVLVGGDFNTVFDDNITEMEQIFLRYGLVRVSTGSGPTNKLKPFNQTLDHVFARGMRALSVGTFKDSQASDHLPLWV